MLQFVCDYCEVIKQRGETWINGVAVENVGTQAARREVVIDPAWRYERAILPLAVHFCSVDCKARYLAELFQKPPALLEMQRVELAKENEPRTMVVKKKPATQVLKKRTTNFKRARRR